MYSEFYHVELDRVRYSLVWEDFKTLSGALQYTKDDHLLIITSAGCNVLNSVILQVDKVTAIDLNPVQNALLRLKMHIIQQHDYSTYAALLGLHGPHAVKQAWSTVYQLLSPTERAFWNKYFEVHPEGLLLSGKLEQYLISFITQLNTETQDKLNQLLTCSNLEEQYHFFQNELDTSGFRDLFINYFNEANLSRGRDAKLFKYAEQPSGEPSMKD
jgi:S-adenosylmethionine-diacylglycerol 3-amino-3-carboxypropyl transferase